MASAANTLCLVNGRSKESVKVLIIEVPECFRQILRKNRLGGAVIVGGIDAIVMRLVLDTFGRKLIQRWIRNAITAHDQIVPSSATNGNTVSNNQAGPWYLPSLGQYPEKEQRVSSTAANFDHFRTFLRRN